MKLQTLRADHQQPESLSWKMIGKLALVAGFCMGVCYLFVLMVTSLVRLWM
jgi:hypothetical protein